MKFILVVEGATEVECAPRFLKRWLDKHLNANVGIEPVWLRGFGQFSRSIGNIVLRYSADPARDEIIAVIGLLDLYGPNFYPPGITSARERHDWGRKHFESTIVGSERFRMFFAVHELEAWILGDPDVLPRQVRENLPVQTKNPETVNFDCPPGRLLDRLYRKHIKRAYEKVKHGKNLFNKLDPDVVRDRCPRLKEMLDEMLKMARAAGL